MFITARRNKYKFFFFLNSGRVGGEGEGGKRLLHTFDRIRFRKLRAVLNQFRRDRIPRLLRSETKVHMRARQIIRVELIPIKNQKSSHNCLLPFPLLGLFFAKNPLGCLTDISKKRQEPHNAPWVYIYHQRTYALKGDV